MTQRYMHLSPAAVDSAIRLLDQPLAVQSFGVILETGRVSYTGAIPKPKSASRFLSVSKSARL